MRTAADAADDGGGEQQAPGAQAEAIHGEEAEGHGHGMSAHMLAQLAQSPLRDW
jgi:hypothetical protein